MILLSGDTTQYTKWPQLTAMSEIIHSIDSDARCLVYSGSLWTAWGVRCVAWYDNIMRASSCDKLRPGRIEPCFISHRNPCILILKHQHSSLTQPQLQGSGRFANVFLRGCTSRTNGVGRRGNKIHWVLGRHQFLLRECFVSISD